MAMKRLLCLSALALLPACQTMPPVADTWEHAYEEAAQAYFRGDYVESGSDARRAMQLAHDQEGGTSLAYAQAASVAAGAQLALANYAEAEAGFKQALAIFESSPEASADDKANAYNNLAEVYRNLDRHEESLSLYEQALHTAQAGYGPDSQEAAFATGALALAYHAQGALDRAEPLYRRALAIREKQGVQDADFASLLGNLADLMWRQGNMTEAEAFARRALAVDEQAFGPNHPDVASDLNTLGVIYDGEKRYPDALTAYRRALEIRKASLGPEHPSTATTLSNIAGTYEALGRYDEAEAHYVEAIRILEKNFDAGDDGLRANRRALADMYRATQQPEKAGEIERLIGDEV